MGHAPTWKTNNFAEITKADRKLSKTFFIKISCVLTELRIFFYFVWYFFAKMGHIHPVI